MAEKDQEENSFQQFKSYLEESLGFEDIKPPPRILSPSQMHALELSCKNGSMGKISIRKQTKKYSEDWKSLPASKQQYYIKFYEIRKRQRADLLLEYELLMQNKKGPSAYICYFRKRYSDLSANSNIQPSIHTKNIAQEWKNLTQKGKENFKKEALMLRQRRKWDYDTRKEISSDYNTKLKIFCESLKEDKEKIIKKYKPIKKQKLICEQGQIQTKKTPRRNKQKVEKEGQVSKKKQKKRNKDEQRNNPKKSDQVMIKSEKQIIKEQDKANQKEFRRSLRNIKKSQIKLSKQKPLRTKIIKKLTIKQLSKKPKAKRSKKNLMIQKQSLKKVSQGSQKQNKIKIEPIKLENITVKLMDFSSNNLSKNYTQDMNQNRVETRSQTKIKQLKSKDQSQKISQIVQGSKPAKKSIRTFTKKKIQINEALIDS